MSEMWTENTVSSPIVGNSYGLLTQELSLQTLNIMCESIVPVSTLYVEHVWEFFICYYNFPLSSWHLSGTQKLVIDFYWKEFISKIARPE